MRIDSIVGKKHMNAEPLGSSIHSKENGSLGGTGTARGGHGLKPTPSNPECVPWSRNLLHTFDELLGHLEALSERKETSTAELRPLLLDGYLTVCALWQILDDYLHRGYFGVKASVETVINRKSGSAVLLDILPKSFSLLTKYGIISRLLLWLIKTIDRSASTIVGLRVATLERNLFSASNAMKFTAERIAIRYAGMSSRTQEYSPEVLESFVACLREIVGLHYASGLRKRTMKIPACFKDFDCHPADCAEFVDRFCSLISDQRVPLTIIGIRTSGSYLAPLIAAYLLLRGYTDVSIESMRQKVRLLQAERVRIRRGAELGMILLVDDPPFAGDSLKDVVRQLEGIGVPDDRIISFIFQEPGAPIFHNGSLKRNGSRDEVLLRIKTILLPKEEWQVAKTLQSFSPLSDTEIPGINGLHFQRARCHEKRLVEHTSDNPEAPGKQRFVAKGSGLGWFRDHVLNTANALADFVPGAEELEDGLIGTIQVKGRTITEHPAACDEKFVRHAARYVAKRAQVLPLPKHGSTDVEDRKTGWHLLAQAFGQSYSFLRSFMYYSLRRKLSNISENAPRAVIDGRMGPSEWILPEHGGNPVKIDFEEHCFDRADLTVFDPAFDLAGLSVEHRLSPMLENILVSQYLRESGDYTAPARVPALKMMYCLAKQVELRAAGFEADKDSRRAGIEITELDRILSNTANEFLATAFRLSEPRHFDGRIFAIDLDGVLEDSILGFSCTTPSGARALRTLKLHGFQPVLATGRSLEEVTDRCRIFGLEAGIAEYGSAIWVEKLGTSINIVEQREFEQLQEFRRCLSQYDDIIIDPAYKHSIRTFRFIDGVRRPVSATWIESLLKQTGNAQLRVVRGNSQTDVVGKHCTKGDAILKLKQMLNGQELHAVGDSIEDISLFHKSDYPYAPSNVEPIVLRELESKSFRTSPAMTQRGLLHIARLACHGSDRSCNLCHVTEEGDELSSILLDVLRLRDRSRMRKMFDLLNPGMFTNFFVSK